MQVEKGDGNREIGVFCCTLEKLPKNIFWIVKQVEYVNWLTDRPLGIKALVTNEPVLEAIYFVQILTKVHFIIVSNGKNMSPIFLSPP